MTRSTDLIMAFGNCDSLFKFYLLFLLIVCVVGVVIHTTCMQVPVETMSFGSLELELETTDSPQGGCWDPNLGPL